MACSTKAERIELSSPAPVDCPKVYNFPGGLKDTLDDSAMLHKSKHSNQALYQKHVQWLRYAEVLTYFMAVQNHKITTPLPT